MARQTRSTSKSTDTSTEAVATTEQEVPVTEQTTEAPASTEATEAPEAPEAPIDLGPFQTVVGEVVTTRDGTTGEITSEEADRAKASYNELDGIKPKNAAKKWAQEQMMEAVNKLDGQLARAFAMVGESLVATGKASTPSTPADPMAAQVAKEASITLAFQLVVAKRPEGFDEAKVAESVAAAAEDVSKMQAWLDNTAEDKGDAPDVSPVVRAAFKLATGKASGGGRTSGGSGPRADIAKHIGEAFAEHPSGHVLKVSEIANFKSSEYPTGNASQGAISARLFPPSGKCTVEGIVPLEKDDSNPRRASKV